MAERFINLRQWEVRAFLAGRKTRVTRVVTRSHIKRLGLDLCGDEIVTCEGCYWNGEFEDGAVPWSPLGVPGDVLIGREKWHYFDFEHVDGRWSCGVAFEDGFHRTYRMVGGWEIADLSHNWQPSSRMPRDASRIRLHVEAVRVQMVQEITEEEAAAEGARCEHGFSYCTQCLSTPTMIFAEQWNEDNKRHPWASSPWAWVGTVRVEVARG